MSRSKSEATLAYYEKTALVRLPKDTIATIKTLAESTPITKYLVALIAQQVSAGCDTEEHY